MPLAGFQAQIDGMLSSGASFDEIEDFVNALPASDEQKSALWLYSWAQTPAATQRRVASETLAWVAS